MTGTPSLKYLLPGPLQKTFCQPPALTCEFLKGRTVFLTLHNARHMEGSGKSLPADGIHFSLRRLACCFTCRKAWSRLFALIPCYSSGRGTVRALLYGVQAWVKESPFNSELLRAWAAGRRFVSGIDTITRARSEAEWKPRGTLAPESSLLAPRACRGPDPP